MDLTAYEEKVQSRLRFEKIIALCSYPLQKCTGTRLLQVLNSHDCAIARRNGQWECIETKESKKLLSRLSVQEHALAASISPMVMTDLAGAMTYVNPAALAAWGYANETDVLHRPATEFWNVPERILAFISEVKEKGRNVCDLVARRKDGTTFDAEVLGSLTLDDRGEPTGIVASCLDVTHRRQSEARRRESDERYRTLVENVELGITLMDSQHQILAINGAHTRMIGRPAHECLGQECFRLFEKRDAICPHCPGTRAMATGAPAETETEGRRDDGTTYAARVQAFPVHGPDGKAIGFIEVVEDITQRKQDRDALHRANFCIEQAGDGILWVVPDGRIVFANPKAAEMLEYSCAELQTKSVFEIDANVNADWWPSHWQALQERKSLILESHHRTKSGRIVPVELCVNHLMFDGKEFNCAFVRDISVRKAAEEQLAHFSAIVNSSQDAIIGGSLDGIITSWNPGAQRLYQYHASEMIGQPASVLLPPGMPDELTTFLSKLREGGRVEHYDTVRRRKDGSLVDVSITLSPIIDSEDRVIGASAIAHEITDRRRAEQSLMESTKSLQDANRRLEDACVKAEAANKAKSEFLANMSHEIRTPMTAIIGFSEVLLEAAQTAEAAEACHIIKRNGDHLLSLINDILDLSKIEAGKHEINLEDGSPHQLVADVVSTMQVRADAKGLRIGVEFLDGVPSAIRTDPLRLRQILVNLLGNAIKFTEVGGVRITVRPNPVPHEAPTLLFSITDTGIGIAASHLHLLFQPFSQADTSAHRRFGGTGLGLAISKRLAAMLGGDITVSSVVGSGTTFNLTVATGSPSGNTIADVANHSLPANTTERPDLPNLNCRVLLAEDGPDNQRLIAFLLRKAGAEVTIVEHGQKAVDLLLQAPTTNTFDVVLMDMQMPVMDGYEATIQLRHAGYQGPIVALTAHAMTEDRRKCLDAGCDDYLAKPVDRHALLEIVAKHAKSVQQIGTSSDT
jgi:PAS domain S-box-containing protein